MLLEPTDCNIFLPAIFAKTVTLKVRTKGITTRLNKKHRGRNTDKKNRSRMSVSTVLREGRFHIKRLETRVSHAVSVFTSHSQVNNKIKYNNTLTAWKSRNKEINMKPVHINLVSSDVTINQRYSKIRVIKITNQHTFFTFLTMQSRRFNCTQIGSTFVPT
jgi:hypothetical protein